MLIIKPARNPFTLQGCSYLLGFKKIIGVCLTSFILYLGRIHEACMVRQERKWRRYEWRAAWGGSGLEQEIDSINLQEAPAHWEKDLAMNSHSGRCQKNVIFNQFPEILSVWSWILLMKVQACSILFKIIWKGTWGSHVYLNFFICIISLCK